MAYIFRLEVFFLGLQESNDNLWQNLLLTVVAALAHCPVGAVRAVRLEYDVEPSVVGDCFFIIVRPGYKSILIIRTIFEVDKVPVYEVFSQNLAFGQNT